MTETFHIRPLGLDDITMVCSIEKKVNFSPWSEAMFADGLRVGYHAWVLEVTHKVVGFIVFSFAVDECQLMNFGVAPAFQHQGFGNRLLTFALNDLKALGCKKCFLDVRRSNVNAQHLYKKFGFEQIAIRKRYYPALHDFEDALVLEMKLV